MVPPIWRCISSRCSATSPHTASDAPALLAATASLGVHDIPTGTSVPLYLYCSSCALRMVPCECCHALLDANRQVDGVLVCTRCGFLTVLDSTLRELLLLPPFHRAILAFVNPRITAMDRLQQQWSDWEARAKQYKSVSDEEPSGASKKRARPETPNSVLSSPTESARMGSIPPELVAEGKAIRSELRIVKKQWRTVVEQAHSSIPIQLFSAMHLAILRAMYETTDKEELARWCTPINDFLLHQSTVVKSKLDLLETLRACIQVEEVRALDKGGMGASDLVVRFTENQAQYQHDCFDHQAREYLRIVGTANKHLFALYNAAQSLAKLQESEATAALVPTDRQRQTAMVSSRSSSPLPFGGESSRHRRVFNSTNSTPGPNASVNDDAVSSVQRAIAMRHRVAEIAKKVELWRSLSHTIASTCVVGLTELARAYHGLEEQ